MNTRDNIQAELQRMSMEIVRLTNEKASQEEYVRFLESENRTIEEETRRECLQQVELANLERDNALKRVLKATDKVALDAKQVAFLVESRMEPALILVNCLFYIERMFLQEDDQSPEARLEFRKKWSEQIVNRLMDMLRKFRAAGDEYGQMVHRAVDYILDDEDAFRTFLLDGRIDMHNIAIERCFRHIAMGRRNWQQAGSHLAAQNISFMFGLLESCKLNKVNFGEYIEDVLTRILFGEEVDESFLPCDYIRRYEDGKDAELPQHAA